MCQRKRCVKTLAWCFIVATISCMDAIKTALTATVIMLTGCSGSAFSTETADDADGDIVAKTDGDDAEKHDVATDAGAGEAASPDADAHHADATPEAASEASTPTCTCGDAGSSCFYSVDEPPSGYGLPYPVTTLALTPGASRRLRLLRQLRACRSRITTLRVYDLDVSAFVSGGTLYIQGQKRRRKFCTVSSYLIAQCGVVSTTGSFPSTPLESSGGAVSSRVDVSQRPTFQAGTTVLHFGTEGSWERSGWIR